MQYIGEHLLIGKIGNLFVVSSFIFAFFSGISYFLASRDNEDALSWKKFARLCFRLHSIAVFGIVTTLFIMLNNHYFEYEYVWHHSNKEMDTKYILSCFWEGQEGSFLLWSFWHVIIGLILQFTAKNFEAPVMAVVSAVQVFLASMLLGIVVFEYKIGSNPFTVFLREHPDYANIPLFNSPDYLTKLDGRGLNPLLQNYWMVIHPPTLFLGFALTVVPFAYALAGLWKKQFYEWVKPALPWTFLGVSILGTGILMGGAWAYEALSFGGFWAWDPVENAVLVPWLSLVAGAHIMIISNKNKSANFFGIFLVITSFILILYSTFLTRSGILGESSVHAFTDLGMSGQLLMYLLFFLFLGILLLLINRTLQLYYLILSVAFALLTIFIGHGTLFLVLWALTSFIVLIISFFKFFPSSIDDDSIWSRDFWMFVASIVLLFASFHIIFFTSYPVWNKLFDLNKAPKDITFYNNWQTPLAFLVTLFVAVGQYFKYKKTSFSYFIKKIALPFVISVTFTICFYIISDYSDSYTQSFIPREQFVTDIDFTEHNRQIKYTFIVNCLLLFSSIFALIANIDYFLRIIKGKLIKIGASLAHVGFAMILLGALISTSKKEVISQNASGKDVSSLGKEFSNNNNILLAQNDTLPMGVFYDKDSVQKVKYYATYVGKRYEGINVLFDVDYFTKNENGNYEKIFSLAPKVQTNPRMGNVAEPDTRHFLTYDIYTHVTYADLAKLNEGSANKDGYTSPKTNDLQKGDTIFASNAIIVYDSLSTSVNPKEANVAQNDIAVKAHLTVYDIGKKYQANPVYVIHENTVNTIESKVDELGLKFLFTEINPEKATIQISLQEKQANIKDFIVMQAVEFPYINILWIGCIFMFLGTIIAIIIRISN